MKWGCAEALRSSPLWPDGGLVARYAVYVGHTLERAHRQADGSYHGWRCQWCGERFQTPGEVARYDLPLMEDVETEDLPTEVVDVAAVLLAVCASTPGDLPIVNDALGDLEREVLDLALDSFSSVRIGMFRRMSDVLPDDRSILTYALAEALIRTGEVKP